MSEIKNDSIGLFQFMSDVVGMTVLHPGGFDTTGKLGTLCGIKKQSLILDVACGKGTSSLYFYNKYGCKVKGIDISEKYIEHAKDVVRNKKLSDEIEFICGNAEILPFESNTFDVVIVQAFLVFLDKTARENVLKEISRVLKPSGYFGSAEMCWFEKQEEATKMALSEKLKDNHISGTQTFADWEKIYTSYGFKCISSSKDIMSMNMSQMFKDEPVSNSMKIMWKAMNDPNVKGRMMEMRKGFSEYNDRLGFGIYCSQKTNN